jgi:hypothetical protein
MSPTSYQAAPPRRSIITHSLNFSAKSLWQDVGIVARRASTLFCAAGDMTRLGVLLPFSGAHLVPKVLVDVRFDLCRDSARLSFPALNDAWAIYLEIADALAVPSVAHNSQSRCGKTDSTSHDLVQRIRVRMNDRRTTTLGTWARWAGPPAASR